MNFYEWNRLFDLRDYLSGNISPSGRGQIDDLIGEVNKEVANKHKVLITTLTKKMAEDLTKYMSEIGIRVKYLHSDIDTLERAEIIRDLRLDVFDVLVGINLLREGLDIPNYTCCNLRCR